MAQKMKSFIKTFLVALGIFAQITYAFAQTAALLPNALQQYFDNNGNPLSLGTVTFYIPGTSTLKPIWQDTNEVTPWANPITLDAGGKPPGSAAGIYGQGTYRQIVKDRLGNTIWDAVTASTGSGGSGSATGDGDLVGTIKPWAGIVAPSQYAFAYGQTVSRTTYAALLTAITQTTNVNCSTSSNVLSGISDTTQINVGSPVEVLCVSPGTTVVSKTSSSVIISNPSTITITASAVFFPFGNGDGSTTFGLPDLRGYAIAGRDNMGNTAAGRLTSTFFGTNPDAQGAMGGTQSKTIVQANLPNINLPSTSLTAISTSVTTLATGSGDLVFGTGSLQSGSGAGESPPTWQTITTTTIGGNVPLGGSSTAFSIIQPTITLNYIIKILPDTNSAIANGVTSLGGMTGSIACGTGLTCTGQTISISLGGNYVQGPNTSIAGDMALYNNTSGNVISDGAFTALNSQTSPGGTRGGLTPSQLYLEIFPGVTSFDAVDGFLDIPVSSTIINQSAIGGYVRNKSGGNGASGNGVALFGIATAETNNTVSWGINTICQDASTIGVGTGTGRQCQDEFDYQIQNPGTVVYGIVVEGASSAQPTVGTGYLVNQIGVGFTWPIGFQTADASSQVGAQFGTISTTANSNGQAVVMTWRDGSNAEQEINFQPQSGFLVLNGSGAWEGLSLPSGSLFISKQSALFGGGAQLVDTDSSINSIFGNTSHTTFINGSTINFSNQIVTSYGTPTIASGACGTTTNGAIAAGGTNQSGEVTIGSASTTTCTISFSTTLASAPLGCRLTPQNAAAAAQNTTLARVSSISTSAWVITGSALANANYYYECF